MKENQEKSNINFYTGSHEAGFPCTEIEKYVDTTSYKYELLSDIYMGILNVSSLFLYTMAVIGIVRGTGYGTVLTLISNGTIAALGTARGSHLLQILQE